MSDWFGDGTDFSSWGATDMSGYTPDASWLNSYVSPSDVLGSRGMYDTGANPATGFTASPSAPFDPGQMANPAASIASGGTDFGSLFGGGGGLGGGISSSPWLGAALGAAGPVAGLLGSLMSGGVTGAQKPTLPPNAMNQLNAGANQTLAPFAQGTSPLQQMQTSLLQSLASGQGLPTGYQQLVEQAFRPQLGDLYTQSAQMGQSRGFYDAPAISPPGGAILGPGLSNLQGQIAAAKLALMQSLPGLYNTPISNQMGAAQSQAGQQVQAANLQRGTQTSQPTGASIGQGLGGILGGAAAGYNATQQANQQQQFQNSLLSALKYPGYGA